MTIISSFPTFALPSTTSATELYKLPNGLTVLIQEDQRFPLVSMRLYVHAGSAYETSDQAGISHLLEHMVFKGTEKRAQGKISQDIEALGGYLNAATSFDYTKYLVDLPAEYWRVGLDVLKDMAFHASITETDLEAEKNVVIAELKRGEDQPQQLLFKHLQGLALDGTPYARPIIGYEENIKGITRQHILDYIKRLYQPQAMLLAVAGKVDKAALRAEIEKIYAAIPSGQGYMSPAMFEPDDLPTAGPKIKIQRGKWNKIYLSLAFPSPGERDTRAVHLDVLAALLGGDHTSYFYRKYKYERQLVDSISVHNYSMERLGLLYFSVVLDEEHFAEFWEEFSKDLAAIDRISFSQIELDRVKLNMEDDLFRIKETISGLADKIGHFAFFSPPDHGEANYLYVLRQTSLENLRGQLGAVNTRRLSMSILLPEKNQNIHDAYLKDTLARLPDPARDKAVNANKTAERGREVIDLGQGRTLILIPDHTLPYVSGSLMFSGGDALLQQNTQGLAALTAAVLTQGTTQRGATEMEDYLADRASSLNAGAGRQSFYFNFTFPSRFSADIFNLLEETLASPALAVEEFERERQNQLAQIKAAEDQPLDMAFRHLFPFLFTGHSYAFMQLGEEATLKDFKVEQIREFWLKQKTLPWTLALCGDFQRDAAIAAAKKLPLPSGKALRLDKPQWNKEKNLSLTLPGRRQSHILLIFPTVALEDRDTPALQLLHSTLTGMSGLLFSELRERQGLGYTVSAIPWIAQKTGMLMFYIATDPDKTLQAKEGFKKVVEDMRRGPLPADLLERGKNSLKGDYYRNMQTLAARGGEAATLFTLGLPQDTSSKQIELAAAVTPEALWKIAVKYLDMDKAYWVEVQP
ncbi:MAG: insulinase family protein [Deltaproteobacteria bacterium]|jgi:zinc protease|nr:insulinase family protein [Deltaproteobacteria bacterium]